MNFLVYISEECKRTCSSVSEWQKFNWRNEVSYYVTKSGLQGQSIAYFHLLTTSIERKIQRCWPKECIPSLSLGCVRNFEDKKGRKTWRMIKDFYSRVKKSFAAAARYWWKSEVYVLTISTPVKQFIAGPFYV